MSRYNINNNIYNNINNKYYYNNIYSSNAFGVKKFLLAIFTVVIFFAFSGSAEAYISSSANYRMESDSVNFGGLDKATSTSYNLSDTLGETAPEGMSSASYVLLGGYRQMDETFISIAGPSDVALSPSIGGVTGGTANGDGTWTVTTDSPAGYNLTIKAGTNPALKSVDDYSFADYTPTVSGTPDFDWNIGDVKSEFGFSPYNALSQADKFKNSGATCAEGENISDGQCWYGFSTSDEQIAYRQSRTALDGETTKINFRAQVADIQEAADYSATITITASSN